MNLELKVSVRHDNLETAQMVLNRTSDAQLFDAAYTHGLFGLATDRIELRNLARRTLDLVYQPGGSFSRLLTIPPDIMVRFSAECGMDEPVPAEYDGLLILSELGLVKRLTTPVFDGHGFEPFTGMYGQP